MALQRTETADTAELEALDSDSEQGVKGVNKGASDSRKSRRKASQRPQGSDQIRQAFSKRKKGLVVKAYQLHKLTDAKVFLFVVNDKGSSWAYASPGFGSPLAAAHLKHLRDMAKVPDNGKFFTEVMPHPPSADQELPPDDRQAIAHKATNGVSKFESLHRTLIRTGSNATTESSTVISTEMPMSGLPKQVDEYIAREPSNPELLITPSGRNLASAVGVDIARTQSTAASALTMMNSAPATLYDSIFGSSDRALPAVRTSVITGFHNSSYSPTKPRMHPEPPRPPKQGPVSAFAAYDAFAQQNSNASNLLHTSSPLSMGFLQQSSSAPPLGPAHKSAQVSYANQLSFAGQRLQAFSAAHGGSGNDQLGAPKQSAFQLVAQMKQNSSQPGLSSGMPNLDISGQKRPLSSVGSSGLFQHQESLARASDLHPVPIKVEKPSLESSSSEIHLQRMLSGGARVISSYIEPHENISSGRPPLPPTMGCASGGGQGLQLSRSTSAFPVLQQTRSSAYQPEMNATHGVSGPRGNPWS